VKVSYESYGFETLLLFMMWGTREGGNEEGIPPFKEEF
jgi:hypothetical protein